MDDEGSVEQLDRRGDTRCYFLIAAAVGAVRREEQQRPESLSCPSRLLQCEPQLLVVLVVLARAIQPVRCESLKTVVNGRGRPSPHASGVPSPGTMLVRRPRHGCLSTRDRRTGSDRPLGGRRG